MRYLNAACAKWRAETHIDFSLYGTPLESTTYKFAKCLQKRFGIVPGVTDKSYITNSYHIHVTEKINAFDKLAFESQFQALSPGGAISYVEVPDMQNNIDAVLEVMKFIYDNITSLRDWGGSVPQADFLSVHPCVHAGTEAVGLPPFCRFHHSPCWP